MATLQYVGARYVPKLMGEWKEDVTYEALSQVTYNNGSYVSSQSVPLGIPPTNTTYWQNNGNRDTYIVQLQNSVTELEVGQNTLSDRIETLEKKEPSGGGSATELWDVYIYNPTATGYISGQNADIRVQYYNSDINTMAGYEYARNLVIFGNYTASSYDGFTSAITTLATNAITAGKKFLWGVSYMADTDDWDNATHDLITELRDGGSLNAYAGAFIRESYALFEFSPDFTTNINKRLFLEYCTGLTATMNVGYPLTLYSRCNVSGGSGSLTTMYNGGTLFFDATSFSIESTTFNSETEKNFSYGSITPSFTSNIAIKLYDVSGQTLYNVIVRKNAFAIYRVASAKASTTTTNLYGNGSMIVGSCFF